MGAKDTVMKERELWEGELISVVAGQTEIAITPLYLLRLAKEYGLLDYQAEISFKAGKHEGYWIGYEDGKQAGIK